ncbi:Hypothetical protein PFL_6279 [Pseudomonas protegens Pf-5]|uniref:Uncharacterized protein n=1 Tax=Pseudomonas fluorescens (strain ATCC BAA-477 / NRRL B-23932 / Pf-5) TaxID=220664 RepID=Q4KA69_PSEF5|nr:Hypothetical protein PFL_6279 [Pseudomonas protegens Pf-5]
MLATAKLSSRYQCINHFGRCLHGVFVAQVINEFATDDRVQGHELVLRISRIDLSSLVDSKVLDAVLLQIAHQVRHMQISIKTAIRKFDHGLILVNKWVGLSRWL